MVSGCRGCLLVREKTQNRDSERQGELTHVRLPPFLSLPFAHLSFSFWRGGTLLETEPRALHFLDTLYH